MYCPYCASENTRVLDSRSSDNGEGVRRRRECQQCMERFTTFENVVFELPMVVKNDGRRENFQEEKLRRGISRAFEKRSFSYSTVEGLVKKIMRNFSHKGDREIQVEQIGEAVMDELRQIDEVAYVRFASVYRQFQDLSEFSEAVEKLKEYSDQDENDVKLSLISRSRKN